MQTPILCPVFTYHRTHAIIFEKLNKAKIGRPAGNRQLIRSYDLGKVTDKACGKMKVQGPKVYTMKLRRNRSRPSLCCIRYLYMPLPWHSVAISMRIVTSSMEHSSNNWLVFTFLQILDYCAAKNALTKAHFNGRQRPQFAESHDRALFIPPDSHRPTGLWTIPRIGYKTRRYTIRISTGKGFLGRWWEEFHLLTELPSSLPLLPFR